MPKSRGGCDVAMLSAINTTLRMLVHERGLVDARDVDVSFDMPLDEWIGSLTRPTVNFFLFDLCENTEKRDGAPQTTRTGTRSEMRMPPRRIDLFYMVSALAGDVDDEHDLLWRVLGTLMKYPQLPSEVLADRLQALTPALSARVATREENRNLLEIWTALGTEPHPAVCYVLTAPMDLALALESPLVLTRTVRYGRLATGGQRAASHLETARVQIGGFVRNRAGEPV